MSDVDETLLPGVLREMVELIGLPATLKLSSKYGGVRLYVPKRAQADHALVMLIGREAVEKLIERFGGVDHFDIPKAQAASIALRNAKINEEYLNLSQRDLALKYGLTERYVREILSKDSRDDSQMALF